MFEADSGLSPENYSALLVPVPRPQAQTDGFFSGLTQTGQGLSNNKVREAWETGFRCVSPAGCRQLDPGNHRVSAQPVRIRGVTAKRLKS